jgi:hypothetical protein
MAGLHPDIVGQMYVNSASRVSLTTIARLAAALGVGIAPAPNVTPDVTGQSVPPLAMPTLLRWEGDTLVWQLRNLADPDVVERSKVIRKVFFATDIERSTLYRIDKGTAQQTALQTLERLAVYLGVGVGEALGNEPATEYLFVWGPPRKVYAPPPIDESPRAGRPSKVCMGPVCLQINPEGVEKRTSAFPKAKRYRYNVGPVCKVCRRYQERQRRLRNAETAQASQEEETAVHS